MNSRPLLLLPIALSALLAAACDRDADTAPADDATTTAPAPAEPAPAEPVPATPAPTTPPAAGAELSFAAMDKNSDGGITQDELSDTDMLHHHFTTADADGNGSLSQAEVDKHRADMAAMPAG